RLEKADDERIFVLGELLRRGMTEKEVYEITKIDPLFINKLNHIINLEKELKNNKHNQKLLKEVKEHGFSDMQVARVWEMTEKEVYTSAGITKANATYYYSTYEENCEAKISDNKKVLVLGSGPIRIGQGIEFDYATVHSVLALQEMGYEAIIMNNNPETVSTDFAMSDKLYFEPLSIEDVMHVVNKEKPIGVIVQFGGQTAINLAEGLEERDVNILGTSQTRL